MLSFDQTLFLGLNAGLVLLALGVIAAVVLAMVLGLLLTR